MYPFGSGMPQPTPPQNQYQPPANNAPFGAGWVQQPSQQPTYGGYPSPQHSNPPYPISGRPNPNINHQSQQSHAAPYPSYGQAAPISNHTPYPGSSFPHNPQHQGHVPYPPSSTNSSSPYPPASAAPYPSASAASYQTSFHHHHGYPLPQIQSPNHPPYPANALQPQAHVGMSGSHCLAASMASDMNNRQSVARSKGTPTVFAAQDFDSVKDAHALRKAMKGFGTDNDALINIICRRTNEQRLEIQRQYKTHFGKDLIEDIKSETSGNFEKLLVGLLRPIVDFYCHELCDAMKGIGTEEEVLIEVLATLSNNEIHVIKNQYLRMYGAHLESELKSETSGNFKRLLVSLCTGARDESGHVDPAMARNDARELLKAGELRVGTDESMFNMILCQRNYGQLKLIFQEYEAMTGHTLEEAIKREFSGDIQEGLLAIYKCVTNKVEYFASRLHKSMAGFGTNDKQLIRVIITRSEIDMQEIKAAFERMYGKSLKSWIKGDTSGNYKHALYALIGEQRSS